MRDVPAQNPPVARAQERRRIPAGAYRALLSATNMKQRARKLVEYTWADRLHYAVAGTPNLLEYDQGFFVKGGDGLADIKPIAGLYKTCSGASRPIAPNEVARLTGLAPEDVQIAYAEISRRREATAYLHAPAQIITPPEAAD